MGTNSKENVRLWWAPLSCGCGSVSSSSSFPVSIAGQLMIALHVMIIVQQMDSAGSHGGRVKAIDFVCPPNATSRNFRPA
jgi:hypothetical protein